VRHHDKSDYEKSAFGQNISSYFIASPGFAAMSYFTQPLPHPDSHSPYWDLLQEPILEEILDGIIEEVTFGFCLEVHRMCRLKIFSLEDTDPDSSTQFRKLIS